jgi:hypothetical protein
MFFFHRGTGFIIPGTEPCQASTMGEPDGSILTIFLWPIYSRITIRIFTNGRFNINGVLTCRMTTRRFTAFLFAGTFAVRLTKLTTTGSNFSLFNPRAKSRPGIPGIRIYRVKTGRSTIGIETTFLARRFTITILFTLLIIMNTKYLRIL